MAISGGLLAIPLFLFQQAARHATTSFCLLMFVSKNAVLMAYCHLKKFREKRANIMKMASFRHGELLRFYFHHQVSNVSSTDIL